MWLSLLRLERKQNSSSNPFRFRIFLCLSYSFGMETINFSSVPIVPSKPIPYSRPKWVQCMYTRFQTKTAQKPYPMVRHIPIAYLREYPPPPPAYVYKGGYRLYMEQVKFFCQHFVYKFIFPSLT